MKTLHSPLSTLHCLQWLTRSRAEEKAGVPRRIWRTRCGRYRVVHSQINGCEEIYWAQKLDRALSVWDTLPGKHHKKLTAMEHCAKDARAHDKVTG